MHNGHGYSPSRSRNQSSRRNMRDVSGPVVPSTPRDTGDGEHIRRRTTFTTKPPTRRDDHRPGGITTLPNWATKYNINRPKGTTVWNKWKQHRDMSNLLKQEDDYHQLAAHDFMTRFDAPEWLGKGLAKGYQYSSELGRIYTLLLVKT